MNYWDFPRCREAFARGQKDARPEVIDGCYYRRRGVNHQHMTLLSFDHPEEAWEQLGRLKWNGVRVQSVNYTSLEPGLPIRKGLVEWEVTDAPAVFGATTGRAGRRLRWLAKQGTVELHPSWEEASRVFSVWAEWAKERHFMVFKGHYLKWLGMFYEDPGACHLIGIRVNGVVEGLFGWETWDKPGDRLAQITIAKHTPALEGKALWVLGLQAIGPGKILCGSTADKLKSELGLSSKPSWMFDLSKL